MANILLRVYVAAAVVAATTVSAAIIGGGGLHLDHPLITLTFAGLLVLGEVFPLRWLRLADGVEVTSSWAFAVGILLMESTAVAIVALAAASIAADLLRRKAVHKVAFNAAQLSLALAAAGWLLDVSNERSVLADPDRAIGVRWFVTIVLTGVVLLTINIVLTTTAVVLSGHTSLAELWPRGLLAETRTDGALLALAPSIVVVSQRSILLLPLGLLTAFIIHRVARQALVQEHEATHDSLTDLWNRRAFVERLDAVIAARDRVSSSSAIILLDLDGFKSVNDTLGHHIGDEILREVGQRMIDLHGPGQMTARLGGDEFATLITHLPDHDATMAWARRLHAALNEPFSSFGFPVQLSASIGVAMIDAGTESSSDVLRAADIAMYDAKRDALGVHVRSRQETGRALGRLDLMAELGGAIDRDELFLEYQPQATCGAGTIYAFEALVRWQHPTMGRIDPGQFMPLAEQTELMQPITRFVLRTALADLAVWRQSGRPVRMAVNVSAQNLHNPHFADTVRDALAEFGLPGHVLELEITENAVMTKREIIRDVLRELRDLGARIVIDDFGTGYSSLSNMRHLPLDGVKIDRSFILDLDRDHDDLVIVSSIIELARNLHLESTAEGVESATAWSRLSELGCDNIQGFLVARPMSADLVPGWLDQYRPDRSVQRRAPWPRLSLVNGSA